MVNLEIWTWAEGQLGNIAKSARQFNLLGEERRSEVKKGEEKSEREQKEENGGKREKEEVEKG